MNRNLPLALLPIALLAACGGGKDKAEKGGGAAGQVAEGTISDAMLPLDTVKSEPPLAAPESLASGSPGAKAKGGAAAAADAAADTGPSPNAGTTPSPSPSRETAPADPIGAAISGQ
jgi:hypothetical protein